jgi:hypothetical protein
MSSMPLFSVTPIKLYADENAESPTDTIELAKVTVVSVVQPANALGDTAVSPFMRTASAKQVVQFIQLLLSLTRADFTYCTQQQRQMMTATNAIRDRYVYSNKF